MPHIEIVGLIAAICTTSAFVPQVYKTWRDKSTEAISLTMYLVFLTGTILWLVYGIHIDSISIILANGITALLAFCVVFLKLKYR